MHLRTSVTRLNFVKAKFDAITGSCFSGPEAISDLDTFDRDPRLPARIRPAVSFLVRWSLPVSRGIPRLGQGEQRTANVAP